jgi:hypothetical protein
MNTCQRTCGQHWSPARLRVVPVTFRQACAFIAEHHRHHRSPRGMKFAVGVARGARLVGVATVGRPVSRVLDDQVTVEVTRTCTLGDPNVNSMLTALLAGDSCDGLSPHDHLHPAR